MSEELLAAHQSGKVQVAVGRASDFFGPRTLNSMMGERVFYPALAGKSAQALGDVFLSRALAAGLETVSPLLGARRGGHVSLKFDNGYEVVQALIARGVIGDFRAPDLMRFGFSPLFLSYTEVWDAADALIEILQTRAWQNPDYARREMVT